MPPEIDRYISPDEARLADAGSRKLFSKPLIDLMDDFERGATVTGGDAKIPWSFFDLLVEAGRRVVSGASSRVSTPPSLDVVDSMEGAGREPLVESAASRGRALRGR